MVNKVNGLSFLILLSLTTSVLLIINFGPRLNWDHLKAQLFQVEPSQVEEATQYLIKRGIAVTNGIHKRDPWIWYPLILQAAIFLWLMFPRAH